MAKGEVRAKMIDAAVVLLATRGLEGTSFADVLAATGASRGSIYHHFPGGKDELIAAALQVSADRAFAALGEETTPRAVIERFIGGWRHLLEATRQRAGCSVLAVAVATDSAALQARTGEIFAEWTARLTAVLEGAGMERAAAGSLAVTALAAMEGAVVLARAQHDITPFDRVADSLLAGLR